MLFSYSGQATLKHAGTTSSRKNGKKNTTERHWTAALADLQFSHLSCGHRWRNSSAATWILLASVRDSGSSTKFTSESSLNHAMQALGHMIKSSVGQHVTCDNKIYQNRPKNWDRIGPMVLKRLACRGGMQCDNLSLLLILVDDTYFALESMFGMSTVWICQFLSVRLLFQDPTHPWEPEMRNILQQVTIGWG